MAHVSPGWSPAGAVRIQHADGVEWRDICRLKVLIIASSVRKKERAGCQQRKGCTSGLHFNPCAETCCIVSRRDSRRAPCGSQAPKEGHAARAPRLPTRGSASAPDGPGPPGALARGPRGGGVQARLSRTPTDPGSLPTGLGMCGSARALGTRSVQSCCWAHVGLPRHFHS